MKGVPVIAPVGWDDDSDARHWMSKNTGRRVHILPPEGITARPKGMSHKSFEQLIEARRKERQQIIKEIEHNGGLFTTYMTFAELIADYQCHDESKAIDRYGMEADRDTRGPISHPSVKITDLLFTGKESVLQEEIQTGIVSTEEAEAQRVMIPPERDAMAEQVMEVLRLLSKADLNRLKIGWRTAGKIKNGDDTVALKNSGLVANLIKYLREQYPEEVSGVEDENVLHAFADNRKRLLDQWKAVKPRLGEMSAERLAEIAGCSKREAIRIKMNEVEPKTDAKLRIIEATRSTDHIPASASIR